MTRKRFAFELVAQVLVLGFLAYSVLPMLRLPEITAFALDLFR